MNELSELKSKLTKNQKIKIVEIENGFVVNASSDDGMNVSIQKDKSEYIIYIGNWHDHFDNWEDAQNIFGLALYSKGRLKCFLKGNFEYKWILEEEKDEKWSEVSTSGLLIYPFWKRTRIIYKQNKYYD